MSHHIARRRMIKTPHMAVRRRRVLYTHRRHTLDEDILNAIVNVVNQLFPFIYLVVAWKMIQHLPVLNFCCNVTTRVLELKEYMDEASDYLIHIFFLAASLIRILSSLLQYTTQNVCNFVIFTATAVPSILKSLLDLIALTSVTCFNYIQERLSVRIILFVISLLVAVGYAMLIFWMKDRLKEHAETSAAQEILRDNLSKQITSLKIDNMKQHTDLEAKQKSIQKLTFELELKDKFNSTLTKSKLRLESQTLKLKLNVKEERERNVLLQADKLRSIAQHEKLKSKAKNFLKEKECLQTEKVQLQKEKEELRLKLKEANKRNMTSKTLISGIKSLEKEISEMKSQKQKLSLELDKEKDKGLCIVCADNHKNILLMPCNHFCLCKKCLGHKKWFECPICRQVIQSTIDVYD